MPVRGLAGVRSTGTRRAPTTPAGFDYFAHANDDVLCIVMIETKAAVADVDDILSVPGIDAVYVGPADLSVTLGLPPAPDQDAASFTDAITRIVACATRTASFRASPATRRRHPSASSRDSGWSRSAADAATLAAGWARRCKRSRPSGESKSSYL